MPLSEFEQELQERQEQDREYEEHQATIALLHLDSASQVLRAIGQRRLSDFVDAAAIKVRGVFPQSEDSWTLTLARGEKGEFIVHENLSDKAKERVEYILAHTAIEEQPS